MTFYECKICNFYSKLRANYQRHLQTKKHINKIALDSDKVVEEKKINIVKKLEDIEKENLELKKKVEELTNKVSQSTHIDNATINNYNFYLNAFGNESISYINKNVIKDLIKEEPMNSVPKLIEKIHFNPDHSENHNIYIPNKKQSLVNIYDGKRWVLKNKRDAIEDMTHKAFDVITENIDGSDRLNKIRDDYDYGDKKTKERLHSDAELVILNNQKIFRQN